MQRKWRISCKLGWGAQIRHVHWETLASGNVKRVTTATVSKLITVIIPSGSDNKTKSGRKSVCSRGPAHKTKHSSLSVWKQLIRNELNENETGMNMILPRGSEVSRRQWPLVSWCTALAWQENRLADWLSGKSCWKEGGREEKTRECDNSSGKICWLSVSVFPSSLPCSRIIPYHCLD